MEMGSFPKILAIYLPQFHETEDNNRWWGKGFTEWDAVKTAEKYMSIQDQPRVPLNNNYYDLTSKSTMLWQANLAKKYGIYGFCFYHYYFGNNKMELEIPAENLLRWKDVPMKFCFNWANSSWIRSWSKIGGNTWFDRYDKKFNTFSHEVLLKQEYGSEEEWVSHFNYLLPFFQDERYIKIDGKPVFIIHVPEAVDVLSDMLLCWRNKAKEEGLSGLYVIGAGLKYGDNLFDANIIYEPGTTFSRLAMSDKVTFIDNVRCFDYETFCNEMISVPIPSNINTFFCVPVGYDDTPRRGENGDVLINNTPEVFKRNLMDFLGKSLKLKNEFLFINAWNEWSECMYLEPDENNQFDYLQAVKDAIKQVKNTNYSVDSKILEEKEVIKESDNRRKRVSKLYEILDLWFFLEQEERVNFKSVLSNAGVENVAIYGMASLGRHLLIQLLKENVTVSFAIDWQVKQFDDKFRIFRPTDKFPAVDAIIITTYLPQKVAAELRKIYEGKIFFLENILNDMARL